MTPTDLNFPTEYGSGSLSLTISDIRQLTPRIHIYELRDRDGHELPLVTAGAHLSLPKLMADGKTESRAYSICSNPARRDIYEIAILQEEDNSNSKSINEIYTLGVQLNCEPPTNNFQLHADTSPAILIAGGIGIAPLKPMAETLASRGRRFQLHYAGRSLNEMAFSESLARQFGNNFFAYPTNENKRIDVMNLLTEAPHNALIYVCAPKKLMDEIYNCAILLGITADRIQSELFTTIKDAGDKPIIVELAHSNKLIQVPADQSILMVLRDAGVAVNFDCCIGDCGTCAVKILAGEAEHRDHCLSDEDRAAGMICICVSRAKSETLILDL